MLKILDTFFSMQKKTGYLKGINWDFKRSFFLFPPFTQKQYLGLTRCRIFLSFRHKWASTLNTDCLCFFLWSVVERNKWSLEQTQAETRFPIGLLLASKLLDSKLSFLFPLPCEWQHVDGKNVHKKGITQNWEVRTIPQESLWKNDDKYYWAFHFSSLITENNNHSTPILTTRQRVCTFTIISSATPQFHFICSFTSNFWAEIITLKT